MTKIFMRFDGGTSFHHPVQRIAQQPKSTSREASTLDKQRQEGKHIAIRKMMNVFEPKKGGGCGSCGGAK